MKSSLSYFLDELTAACKEILENFYSSELVAYLNQKYFN